MQNKTEFVRVIRENEALIYKVSKVYTNRREDEQDLYQEIVYQLWKSFGSFRNESKISTWMYRIALNTAISNLNKEKRKGTFLPINEWVLNATKTDDPLLEERFEKLYAHIRELSTVEKGTFSLKRIYGYGILSGIPFSMAFPNGYSENMLKQLLKRRIF
jgi:RNA polymerase sigma-70 factor, ECF subfamily